MVDLCKATQAGFQDWPLSFRKPQPLSQTNKQAEPPGSIPLVQVHAGEKQKRVSDFEIVILILKD